MQKTEPQNRRKIKSSYVLSALFCLYVLWVGLAALPETVYNLGNTLFWKSGYQYFIDTTNQQFEGMLSTGKDFSGLQNKAAYINLNGLLARTLGQPFMKDCVMLKNGHLASIVPEEPEPEYLHMAADNIRTLFQKQRDDGKQFLFVMAPSQISKYEDLLPTGYTDTTNDTADSLLALLEQYDVPYLDLREQMHTEGLSVTDTHFKTDHHWTPQTGFWAYTKILEKLTAMGAIEKLDGLYTDPQQFAFDTYEDTFLGSWGKRTGLYYTGVDDSIFIRPEFENRISVTIEERNLQIQGPYEEVCYNTEVTPDYENPDYFNDNMYGLYGWGDMELTQWRNENAPITSNVLLIGESFGNIPFSLMSLVFSSCDEMDTRSYTGDFSQYYSSYCPDTVILLVNADHTLSPITLYTYF